MTCAAQEVKGRGELGVVVHEFAEVALDEAVESEVAGAFDEVQGAAVAVGGLFVVAGEVGVDAPGVPGSGASFEVVGLCGQGDGFFVGGVHVGVGGVRGGQGVHVVGEDVNAFAWVGP